jgi:hypothetical protein
MSALYEVRLIADCKAIVRADSPEAAVEAAKKEAACGDYHFAQGMPREVTDEEARPIRMAADVVLA